MCWIEFLVITVLLVVCELVYFKIANRFDIIDKPNQRSSHTSITLRGGGIIFALGMLLFFVLSDFTYPWFIGGLLIMATIAFIDDVRPLPNRLRLILQFISMLLMFQELNLFFAFPWWYVIIALVISVGIINAYNFMDGINGITGGYSLAVLLPLLYINEVQIQFIEPSFLYIATISVLVFNFFNFRTKAKCFAGDVGSISIAFVILFALGSLILTTGNFYYIGFLALYGVDSVLTICHRMMLKENIFEAHRKHVYQIMANELKMPHVRVSALYMMLQLLISAGFIFLAVHMWMYFVVVIGGLAVVYLLFMKKFFRLHII